MLQRAASNAYSWWWASHIRTKQSKWLEQSLQDMEEKVKYTLKLIDDDGDSFAKRAEMYYRKRPELISFVEESYRAYRALAERYDHISGELQNANNTLATVFPDKVEFEEEDEDNSQKTISVDEKKLPKPPENPKFKSNLHMPRKSTKKQIPHKKEKAKSTNSQMSKEKAQEEIDKLQKGILVLQTEKEFVKSAYENGLAKYWDIEKRITEMQEQVCNLQDDFSVSSVIEDDEARALMTATALKSCEDALVQLVEQRQKAAEEVKVEAEKIKETEEKLKALGNEFCPENLENLDLTEESTTLFSANKPWDEEVHRLKQEKPELQTISDKVKEYFEMNSDDSLTVTELAEKVDEIVNKVLGLETEVSMQNSLIERLRSETVELQRHLESLEEDKTSMLDESKDLKGKFRELVEEFHGIKDLTKILRDQATTVQAHFTEACRDLDDLSGTMQSTKQQTQAETTVSSEPEEYVLHNVEFHEEQLDETVDTTGMTIAVEEEMHGLKDLNLDTEDQENHVQSEASVKIEDPEKQQDLKQQDEIENQDSSKTEGSSPLTSELEKVDMEPGDSPDWQQLFLAGLEDREKILLAEYTSTLRNCKETKRKLAEAEKENQENHFKTMAQLMELKSAIAIKDAEINNLRQKLSVPQTSTDENIEAEMNNIRQKLSVLQGNPYENKDAEVNKRLGSVFDGSLSSFSQRQVGRGSSFKETTKEWNAATGTEAPAEEDIKLPITHEAGAVSKFEEKFRRDIDELLEQNLDFWLRFSTSFHQMQKFQTAIQEIQDEFSKLKNNKKQEGGSNAPNQAPRSEAAPIHKGLKELKSELSGWLEQNASLKKELQCRLSSLSNLEEEIARVVKDNSEAEQVEFTAYQAEKFQGEVRNMQQENKKVEDELQAGLDHVMGLQNEVDRTMVKLDEHCGFAGPQVRHSISRGKIPLRSFIFGTKPKKPSIFSCMNPALQKQYSDLRPGFPM